MSESQFFVAYNLNPVRLAAHGGAPSDESDPTTWMLGSRPDGWRWLSREEWDELCASDEPSKVIADWLGLPYQKYLEPDPGSQINVVELIADGDDSAFDQPCAFGHRVEGHAVYCHNSRWVDSPRKCRRTWATGGERRDSDCPGFVANPRPGAGSEKYTAEEAAAIQREKDEASAREQAEWDAMTPEQQQARRDAVRRFMDEMSKHMTTFDWGAEP